MKVPDARILAMKTIMMKVFLLMFSIICMIFTGNAQSNSAPLENDPANEFDQEITQGVSLMNKGAYKEADTEFRAVLASVKTVPADLCFYFGKNSYHLQKYKQSIDWLTKYIELKGSYGTFYDQATEYTELARAGFKTTSSSKNSSKPAKGNATASKKASDIDCTEHPYVTCPVCQGDGVIVQKGRLGASVYKTCPYSDEYGRMTCEDYKLYVKGKLIIPEQK